MGLFGKNKDGENWEPGRSFFDELPARVDYESVLEYLAGLSDTDFDKVCKLAGIYREARQKAADTLGVEREVTTYIYPPTNGLDEALAATKVAMSILDDEPLEDFLDEEKPKASKPKKDAS